MLKHYACLWPKKKSTNLYIVNIQWTPKDKFAKTKINGYCDEVLKNVVKYLQKTEYPSLKINNYSIRSDPIFKIAVKLDEDELKTTTKPHLLPNKNSNLKKEKSTLTLKAYNEQTDANDSSQAIKEDVEEEPPKNVSSSNSWFTKSFKPRKQSVKSEKK